jgi:hypothetical protein
MYRLLLLPLLLLTALSCTASDHADTPLYNMSRDDLKITGLLSFVDGSNLILILATNPSLVSEGSSHQFPTDASFNIYIDYDSVVDFSDVTNTGLYGGTLLQSNVIKEDVSISIKFDKKKQVSDDNTFTATIVSSKNIQPEDLRIEGLVRDDPFTFPSFNGQNIAAIVVSMPLAKLNIPTEQPLLLWATVSTINSGQEPITWEYIGRGLRSQIAGRWAFNHYPPAKQEGNIGMPADVMIYDRSRTARLPNGRALADDTLAILCAAGDSEVCDLKAKAVNGTFDSPYTGANDKAFLSKFPYLPEPH